MGDQAGRKHPPRRPPRKLVFDKSRVWIQLVAIVALSAAFTYIVTLIP